MNQSLIAERESVRNLQPIPLAQSLHPKGFRRNQFVSLPVRSPFFRIQNLMFWLQMAIWQWFTDRICAYKVVDAVEAASFKSFEGLKIHSCSPDDAGCEKSPRRCHGSPPQRGGLSGQTWQQF
jgi:hypothetical protein